jgi:hypothetical protein
MIKPEVTFWESQLFHFVSWSSGMEAGKIGALSILTTTVYPELRKCPAQGKHQ